MSATTPRLRLILGDQLQHDSPQLAQFDAIRTSAQALLDNLDAL